ncbi:MULTISPECIES: hypothetical protein [Bacillus]|uniref:Spore coat protein n=2 Tax=Bacillus TaxID=1386 RepID=A0A0M4G721_9BACI|nr:MULTISPECIES: hypothetical protein [Bacillus]ALC80770.1 hypothetical protein AM592_03565 [Bacillus gobiensis]MBP1079672.1 spore coat protein W [Bacillus capparidis]MED1095073.1 spore coat protein [Bacillus capparidis]
MSNDPKDAPNVSDSLMQLFVSNVFKKNNVAEDDKRKLSSAEKQQIRQIVEDLQSQVNEFIEKQKQQKQEKTEAEEVQEAPKNTTLREIIRRRKDK